MNKLTKTSAGALLALTLSAVPAGAQSNDNSRYGEVNLRRLHGADAFVTANGKTIVKDRAQVSKVPWVGSWWAYSRDGISSKPAGQDLSPAEKIDKLDERTAKIESAKVTEYHQKIASLNAKAVERQNLQKTINRLMRENRDNEDFRWQDTTEGKRYQELSRELDTGENQARALLTVDTATEFEKVKHGNGTLGVQGWWGHCNAWAAAAIMDPEPRKGATVNGLLWTTADVKGLLTEAWMEHNSSFFGSRNGDSSDTTSVNYKDVTPAAFHVYFADQLGNKDKSFVIDRFTGEEVWNQPIRGYMTKAEPLPKETKELEITRYGYDGKGTTAKLASRDVYPLQVTTTFHWITDGVPAEALNVEDIQELDTEEEFSNAYAIERRYHEQVEVRTVSYKLYLDKPVTDPAASIVGDGDWMNQRLESDHSHPDFLWQPLSQGPSRRDYENPFVDYDRVKRDVLPKMTVALGHTEAQPPPAPTAGGKTFKFNVPAAGTPIPDGIASGVSITLDIPVTTEKILKAKLVPNVAHTYRGDLKITLQHKRIEGGSGQVKTATLKKAGDGGSADDWSSVVDLPTFKGRAYGGKWTLKVVDSDGGDKGTIKSVDLVINY